MSGLQEQLSGDVREVVNFMSWEFWREQFKNNIMNVQRKRAMKIQNGCRKVENQER